MAYDKRSVEAVEALHKTMLLLRQELSCKNQRIQFLESKVKWNTIDTESTSQDIIEDPVLDFVLEEDPEPEREKQEFKVHKLTVNEDFDIHWPPATFHTRNVPQSTNMTFSEIRPILRHPKNSPRSCRGSQTDISALHNQAGNDSIYSLFLLKSYIQKFVEIVRTAPWLSWLKRLSSKQEIVGSNPAGAFFYSPIPSEFFLQKTWCFLFCNAAALYYHTLL